jgi:hypothetical protein
VQPAISEVYMELLMILNNKEQIPTRIVDQIATTLKNLALESEGLMISNFKKLIPDQDPNFYRLLLGGNTLGN